MQYFITGATGFIGKRLVGKLLERDDARIFFRRDTTHEAVLFKAFGLSGYEGGIDMQLCRNFPDRNSLALIEIVDRHQDQPLRAGDVQHARPVGTDFFKMCVD